MDRIFADGRNRCPVVGCHQELWRREWKTQTFGDLVVEREVTLRKMVFGAMRYEEGDFETKMNWDDFLEERESVMFDLLSEREKVRNAARRKVEEYAKGKVVVRGLRKVEPVRVVAEEPYDPFMGMRVARDYYVLRDEYPTQALTQVSKDVKFMAGGYSFNEFHDESLCRAFAGLGVFISEEKITA